MEIWSKNFEINAYPDLREKDISNLRNNLNGQNLLRRRHTIPKFIKKKFKKAEVVIYEHALRRWNTRVGPCISSDDLSQFIKILIRLNRIYFAGDDYGYIDNDILFIYEWTNGREISIITFYGRISNNISLQNFSNLRRYNRANEEQLHLELSEDELKNQKLPVLPYKIVRYFIERKKFELSFYRVEGEDKVIFIEQGEGVNYVQILTNDELNIILTSYPEIQNYLYT